MSKRNWFILIFLHAVFLLQGQPLPGKDSLRDVYLAEKNDSLRIEKHIAYIHALLYDYEKQKETTAEIELLKQETRNTRYPEFSFWTLYFEGLSEYNNYHFLNSIIAIEKMNRVAQRFRLSVKASSAAASSLITLGLNYSMLNDGENAHLSYQKAIRSLQSINDSSNILLAYINTGYLFIKSRDWVSAVSAFEKGMLYLDGTGNKNYTIALFASLSEAASRSGDLIKAEEYLLKAKAFAKIENSVLGDAFYQLAAGELAFSRKAFTEAVTHFGQALELNRRWGDSSFVAQSYERLGVATWNAGDQERGLDLIDEALKIADKQNLPEHQLSALRTKFDVLNQAGNYADATGTAARLLLLTDSLSLLLNNNRRIIMSALFESEQQAQRISELEHKDEWSQQIIRQKNIITVVLFSVVVAVLTVLGLLYRTYRQKQQLQIQQIRELEQEKQLSATQALLKGQEEERNRLAKDLHDGLGGLLSGVKLQLGSMKGTLVLSEETGRTFNSALNKLDESISEMRRVAHNMMPEALVNLGLAQAIEDYCAGLAENQLFVINCQFHGLEKRLESSVEIAVYRIVQELLNNAVKHSGATTILAQVMRQGNNLTITVEDNGKGIAPEEMDAKFSTGLKSIQSRVNYLRGNMNIKSEISGGYSVHIECTVD